MRRLLYQCVTPASHIITKDLTLSHFLSGNGRTQSFNLRMIRQMFYQCVTPVSHVITKHLTLSHFSPVTWGISGTLTLSLGRGTVLPMGDPCWPCNHKGSNFMLFSLLSPEALAGLKPSTLLWWGNCSTNEWPLPCVITKDLTLCHFLSCHLRHWWDSNPQPWDGEATVLPMSDPFPV